MSNSKNNKEKDAVASAVDAIVTPQRLLVSNITWFGSPACLMCDGKCEKAWGINARPQIEFDENEPDDTAYFPDQDLGEAPKYPGTYEGGHGKPQDYDDVERHNKWCARECERSVILDKKHQEIEMHDWSKKLYNQPWKHEAAG